MKTCITCNSVKPLIDFVINKKYKSGVRGTCKVCWNLKHKNNRTKDYVKNQNLKKTYGITLEIYNNLAASQEYKCRICMEEKFLVVDHDHETGIIRGLLCSLCNSALGFFKDDIKSLENAVEYLKGN